MHSIGAESGDGLLESPGEQKIVGREWPLNGTPKPTSDAKHSDNRQDHGKDGRMISMSSYAHRDT